MAVAKRAEENQRMQQMIDKSEEGTLIVGSFCMTLNRGYWLTIWIKISQWDKKMVHRTEERGEKPCD